ncbi:hypothetical protein H8B09_19700 [Paenibacillus sp. PR3]|uniref:Uncharacterized protein n=1 Tax=Paenibacillus terricola TaxID=2763503 RepID=A0ABR8N1C2_9BACL|nr:hypothetical protein [Paenibacillus terricola]MBD3921000.1 hypothetical protein [Paenibacillus terricola]
MSVLQMARQLHSSSVTLLQLQRDKQQLQAYQTRQQELNKIRDDVASIFAIFTVFSNAKLYVPSINIFEDLLNSLVYQLNQYKEVSDWVKTPRVFISIESKLKSLQKDTLQTMTIVWHKYLDENKPNISNEILNVVKEFPEYENHVEQIRRKLVEYQQLYVSLPSNTESVQSVLFLKSTIEKAWRTIGIESLPERVFSFLQQASGPSGADLSLLNDEVLTWLHQKNVLNSFKIKLQK